MLIVWQSEQCTVKDIRGRMSEPRPPYTTVASIVKNLERKGYVDASLAGNTYVYSPAITENDYKLR